MSDYLDLYDYRCRVAHMYRQRTRSILDGEDPHGVWQRFCAARDELFAHHPQSALDEEQRRTFRGLRYFPYNPSMRFVVDIDTDVEPVQRQVTMNANETMPMTTVGRVRFIVDGEPATLSLYWLEVYAGGLFLPFRDQTCPHESYGGGRYLFDTLKGSELLPATAVPSWKRIVLDFNYAYNPSCAYNDRWLCPLAPGENTLGVPIRAGELKFNP
jgi:uncharacterized protein (DUF1684 family)